MGTQKSSRMLQLDSKDCMVLEELEHLSRDGDPLSLDTPLKDFASLVSMNTSSSTTETLLAKKMQKNTEVLSTCSLLQVQNSLLTLLSAPLKQSRSEFKPHPTLLME